MSDPIEQQLLKRYAEKESQQTYYHTVHTAAIIKEEVVPMQRVTTLTAAGPVRVNVYPGRKQRFMNSRRRNFPQA
jgi:hypothetical protein